MSHIVVKKFDNGLRLVIVPMKHLHVAETAIYVAAGGRDELPEQAGISHFLEHCLFRGCKEMPTSLEIEAAFERIGGTVNASTDAETTCYYSRVHPTHIAESLRLFAAMVQQPLFNDIEIERQIITEEALDDYNEHGDDISTDNLTSTLLWPGHPLGLPTIGTPDSINAIDGECLSAYHQAYYRPEQTVICVAGRFDIDAAESATRQWWGNWQGAETSPPVRTTPTGGTDKRVEWVADATSQINIQITFPIPGRTSPEADTFRLLRRVLAWGGTSRLMLELREKDGLVYNVEAGATHFQDTGCFSIDLAISPEKLPLALERLTGVFKELATEPIPESELAAAVQLYQYDLDFSWDHPEGMIYRFGFGEMTGTRRTPEGEAAAIKSVTAKDLQQVVAQYLDPKEMKVAIVGPIEKIDKGKVEEILFG